MKNYSIYKWVGILSLIVIMFIISFMLRKVDTALVRTQNHVDKIMRDKMMVMDSISDLNYNNYSLLESITF
jgi:hypothetical protein